MDKKLKLLKNRLQTTELKYSAQIVGLQRQIQAEYDKVFKKDKRLQKAVNALDSSNQYGYIQNDEFIHHWIRFDLSKYKDCQEYLETYLSEYHCAYPDFKNDALSASVGPSIIINEDGDAIDEDSGKWIVSKRDYANEDELHTLIEEYMEKTGYFPGVFRVTRYGDVHFVRIPNKTKIKGDL